MITPINPTCLSHWFPILQKTGVPVPRTEIVRVDQWHDLVNLLDGKKPKGFESLMTRLHGAAMNVGGYPVFLRTGQTSGKHEWEQTCYVKSKDVLGHHVAALVEFSECADFMGLPYDVFVVREFLKLETAFTAFDGFPVNKERRFFLRDHRYQCSHPYWPEHAVAEGRPSDAEWREKLAILNKDIFPDIKEQGRIFDMVAAAFDGYWSVDFAKHVDGRWLCIDMAEGDKSFHWIECEHCPPETRERYTRRKAERDEYIGDSLVPVEGGE